MAVAIVRKRIETKLFPFLPAGSYGTIDLNLVYDEANLLLVVNVIKARVSWVGAGQTRTVANKRTDTASQLTDFPSSWN